MSQSIRKIIALTVTGGALEFYDFTIYALFAPYLSYHFFPNVNRWVMLINTFAVFVLGYLARPLGGIFWGHIGDRHGRKTAFTSAIFLMAISTLLMGCIPGYRVVGALAPSLLIVLRLAQGFSLGGEIPGATLFILEHVDSRRIGLWVGVLFGFITLGNMLGALVGVTLTTLLNPATMLAWGWRIPFFVGFLLGIVSFMLRLKALETPVFQAMLRHGDLHRVPFLKLMSSSGRQLFVGVASTAMSAAMISFFLYSPTYLSTVFHLPMEHDYLTNTINFLVFALSTIFFGWLSDFVGRKRLMIMGAIIFMLGGYGLFKVLILFSGGIVILFGPALATIAGIANGCYGAQIASLFPANLRYSGMGLSYNIGLGVVGGLAPVTFTYLLESLGNPIAPYYYLCGAAFLTLLGVLVTPSANYLSDIDTSVTR